MGEANSCVQSWNLLIRWLFISLPLWISCFLPLPLPLPPPSCPTPALIYSFCWLFAKRSVHSASSWKPIVTPDSGKVMHHSLGKLKIIFGTSNGIYWVLFHLEYFALHSQGIRLFQGQSQVSNICMKSLTRWFYVMNTLPLLSYVWCTLVINWVNTTSWLNF